MLVVDGVELDVLDHRPNPGIFDGDETVVGNKSRKSADEVVQVGDVRHHVVGDDDICRSVIVTDLFCEFLPEEIDNRRDARILSRCRWTRRGIDAERANTVGRKFRRR